jgi:hypothetical protein
MKSLAKHLVGLAALVAALAAIHPVPPASAASPCWKLLLNDWYDGRIDKTYSAVCYRTALKHLPTDVDVYTSARSDIERALASAIRQAQRQHRPVDQVRIAPTPFPSKDEGGNPGSGASAGGTNQDEGPVNNALGSVSTSADSVPLPLVVLGALALLLVAAGLAGVAYRHFQGRQTGP